MVTILSIPRSGTRFYMYFVMYVLKLPIKYKHFFNENKAEIEQYISCTDDVIIAPVRSYNAMAKSFTKSPEYRQRLDDEFVIVRDYFQPHLAEYGAHFMNIEKNENTITQFDNLLSDLGLEWTPEITEYVNAWEKIGSQYASDDKSSMVVKNVKDKRTLI